jgi:hypothetical protein
MKKILLVGETFYDFEETQRVFTEGKCAINDCSLTRNADKEQRTADAVMIFGMDAETLSQYLPKPVHQVTVNFFVKSTLQMCSK